jgi:dimethylamine monooxygenase subunit C
MSAYTYRVRSQPEYPSLKWDHSGVRHLLVILDLDEAAIAHLCQSPCPGPLRVLIRGSASDPAVHPLIKINPMIHSVPTMEALMTTLQNLLNEDSMGLRLYAFGHEDGLWKVRHAGEKLGMSHDEIQLAQAVTTARPVYCVHCGHHMNMIHTNITVCSGCGRNLMVRDHFSRNLGAYMGFQVDAECPGVLPPVEEVFP